ncbi:MAG: glycosyltransferase family 4 protein [candidate division WOR-3 bacterium]
MEKKHYILITPEYPPFRGGISRCLSSIYGTFPSDSLTVIAPYFKGSEVFDFNQNYKIKRLNKFFYFLPKKLRLFLFIFSLTFSLFLEVLKNKEKKIVIHSGHVLSGISAFILKKILKVPYIQWTHAIEVMDKRRFWLIKNILNFANYVITISKFSEDYLKRFVSEEKIKKIRHPLPEIKYPSREMVEKVSREVSGKKVILTVARLEKFNRYKGVDLTIRSFKKVKEEIPESVYIVIGGGDLKSYYEEMAKSLGLGESVFFKGEISDDELYAWYSICDLFVMPSRVEKNYKGILGEGFGLVFLEAGFFGKPVIGGEGGCKDAIINGVTGFLVNPRDEDDLAEKIVYLLRNPSIAKKMGEEGKRWAESVKREELGLYLRELL